MENFTKTAYIHDFFCRQSCIGSQTRFLWTNNDKKLCFLCRMVLEWREREHGDVEEVVQADLVAQKALQECVLYKFWVFVA